MSVARWAATARSPHRSSPAGRRTSCTPVGLRDVVLPTSGPITSGTPTATPAAPA
jgi:hypothetical protein